MNINTKFNNDPFIYGTPLAIQNWPQSRGVPRILYLHKGPKEWGEQADLSKIIEDLPHGAVAVDIGTGSGKVPQHFGALRPDLHWELVSVNALDPFLQKQLVDRGSNIYHCYVPNDLKLLKNQYAHCHFLVDSYGAVCYDDNPDHVLIFYSLLLAPGGTASIMVSTTKDDVPTHVFSTDETLQQIADFLKKRLEITLEWHAKKIKSEAKPGTFCTDFLFRMKASDAQRESTSDPEALFFQLCTELREVIGTPRVVEDPWYTSGDFQIVAKKYSKDH